MNSQLRQQGAVQFVDLTGDEKRASENDGGDGKAVYLDGSSWFSAGQGANGELNITGKGITLFVRMKADTIKEYSPLLTKSGNDQNMAYSIALHKEEGDVYIEAMLGSDDIGGAHLLKYRVPKEEWLKWHDILFRFNGKISELYIDGVLRDNEVTVGETRDWNHQPVLIGAQYKLPYTSGDSAKNSIESTFKGWIDCVAIWNQYVTDDKVASLSGATQLKNDGLPEYYKEKYRPQFHFTARKNWLNDPNGLVYYNGTYHLFFQYMPPHRHGAYKDWGHAISKDLVHWEQVPQHITPHKVWGGCWSGSAIVDLNNASRFQTGSEKPIIAFITNGGSPDDGFGPKCTQCIAYSTDGGETFTYYDQNPVIKNINGSNRDPKVVWDPKSRKFILSLYMDKDNDYGLFSSADCKNWEYLSTVSLKGVTECPGFQPLPVDGDTSKMKWLLFGANGHYVVGSFNGKTFTPETDVQTIDYGKNFYAAQTWNNSPDGRCIHIAWMPTKPYPGMPFEQQMTFPTELSLQTTPAGIRVFRTPVKEISNLYDKEVKWQKTLTSQSENPLKDLTNDLYDISLEVDVRKAASFNIMVRGATIHYDAVRQMISFGGPTVDSAKTSRSINLGEAPLRLANGKVKLRILVDRTTVEIYGNDGQVVLSSCFMPEEAMSYALTTDGEINAVARIHSLKSAWGGH
ncbi:MAG: GH32 C-terminal domain-containing protein [Puia sp.]|nr:GH32 C-terminal domain-containing protein [Puia sp.]